MSRIDNAPPSPETIAAAQREFRRSIIFSVMVLIWAGSLFFIFYKLFELFAE